MKWVLTDQHGNVIDEKGIHISQENKSNVNHPDHYGGDTPYETIKVIKAWKLNFQLGNAVKYLSRAGKKDPSKKIEDLQKAIFYIQDEIKESK